MQYNRIFNEKNTFTIIPNQLPNTLACSKDQFKTELFKLAQQCLAP